VTFTVSVGAVANSDKRRAGGESVDGISSP
jgi:hypothetical protein